MKPQSTITNPGEFTPALPRTPMKIVIPGGSGQVGSLLTRAFRADGHNVVVISRNPHASASAVIWDGKTVGAWAREVDGADVVINLAGHTVNCRYNRKNRDRILRSRVDSTRAVGEAIRQAPRPPHTWLQASTATIYAHRYDAPNDEATGVIGGGEPEANASWRFSNEVANAWEAAVDAAIVPQTRRMKLRSVMTMSPDPGGIFDVLLGLVRRGLGGLCGDGRQYVSWVHYGDFVRAVYWMIEHKECEGVVNVASPNPLPNAEFMRDIRNAWGIRFGLPAKAWMLGIGAMLLRTETELILKSRRVVPGLLVQHGFAFQHPTWAEAALDLCREWRARRGLGRSPLLTRNFSCDRKD